MDNRYKVIISNKNLYKEIELTADTEELKVGTGIDCGVRLYKDLFFGRICSPFSNMRLSQTAVRSFSWSSSLE